MRHDSECSLASCSALGFPLYETILLSQRCQTAQVGTAVLMAVGIEGSGACLFQSTPLSFNTAISLSCVKAVCSAVGVIPAAYILGQGDAEEHCQELQDLLVGKANCLHTAYWLWHEARQKSHRNIIFGCLNGCKKKVTLHYGSMLVLYKVLIEVRWIFSLKFDCLLIGRVCL